MGYLCPKLSALGGVIMEINILLGGGSVAARYLPRGKIMNHFLGELFVWGTYKSSNKVLRDMTRCLTKHLMLKPCTICGVSAEFVM